MEAEGAAPHDARQSIWLLDSDGLVHDGRRSLEASKAAYAQPHAKLAHWNADRPGLSEVVHHVKPTILLGTSAQPGIFTEPIVREMAASTARPIIFPLSNPTSKSEATPADLLAWTDGRALVATGSPFPDVRREGRVMRIGQCNNAFVFPGVGLGALACGARRMSDAMFVAAGRALAGWSPVLRDPDDALYPRLECARAIARDVALAVGLQAVRDGIADRGSTADLEQRVGELMWRPEYPSFRALRSGAAA
jgi:malate dehydrogenase (oxaloacetate-decarboxylating)